jgi:hypothetical protein
MNISSVLINVWETRRGNTYWKIQRHMHKYASVFSAWRKISNKNAMKVKKL